MVAIIMVIASIVAAALLPFESLPGVMGDSFREGGWGMRPIAFALLISVWLAIDRSVMLMRSGFKIRRFYEGLSRHLATGDINGAVALCRDTDRPATRIIAAGLAKSEEGEHRVLAAMDECAYGELPEIEKKTGFLALMGNVATLMGLFGTIIGLIESFGGVASEQAAEKATALAAGISEAMNCTAFGLLAGITGLAAFSVLNGKTQAVLDDINHLTHRAYRKWRASASHGKPVTLTEAQPIKSPHAHLLSHAGLFAGTGHGGHGRKSTFAGLQLTPLIDMFIVMVIFLLMSFSASGELQMVSKDVKLPFAERVSDLERAPVISISYPKDDKMGGVVTVEGEPVSTARELMENEGPDFKIVKLTEKLDAEKQKWKTQNQSAPFKGDLIVHCDQSVDFKIIKQVIYSSALAGYTSIHFAVTEKPKGKAPGGH
jgi:biopolymer transport protein ExbB